MMKILPDIIGRTDHIKIVVTNNSTYFTSTNEIINIISTSNLSQFLRSPPTKSNFTFDLFYQKFNHPINNLI